MVYIPKFKISEVITWGSDSTHPAFSPEILLLLVFIPQVMANMEMTIFISTIVYQSFPCVEGVLGVAV